MSDPARGERRSRPVQLVPPRDRRRPRRFRRADAPPAAARLRVRLPAPPRPRRSAGPDPGDLRQALSQPGSLRLRRVHSSPGSGSSPPTRPSTTGASECPPRRTSPRTTSPRARQRAQHDPVLVEALAQLDPAYRLPHPPPLLRRPLARAGRRSASTSRSRRSSPAFTGRAPCCATHLAEADGAPVTSNPIARRPRVRARARPHRGIRRRRPRIDRSRHRRERARAPRPLRRLPPSARSGESRCHSGSRR